MPAARATLVEVPGNMAGRSARGFSQLPRLHPHLREDAERTIYGPTADDAEAVRAEKLTARAIRERKNLEASVAQLLEAESE